MPYSIFVDDSNSNWIKIQDTLLNKNHIRDISVSKAFFSTGCYLNIGVKRDGTTEMYTFYYDKCKDAYTKMDNLENNL